MLKCDTKLWCRFVSATTFAGFVCFATRQVADEFEWLGGEAGEILLQTLAKPCLVAL